MTITTEQAAAIARLKATFNDRAAALTNAIREDKGEYVLGWGYGLAVLFTDGKPQAVAPERATAVQPGDPRNVFNGRQERAKLMRRAEAMAIALKATLDGIAAITKTEA